MVKRHPLWIILRSILVILYALSLLLLIPTFFYHYEGMWIEKIAEKIPLKEMNFNIDKPKEHEKEVLP